MFCVTIHLFLAELLKKPHIQSTMFKHTIESSLLNLMNLHATTKIFTTHNIKEHTCALMAHDPVTVQRKLDIFCYLFSLWNQG